MTKLSLDTDTHVYFYEQDFYVLSNFSSFEVKWKGMWFATSEHAYHYEKFCLPADAKVPNEHSHVQWLIFNTRSAHDAFKVAAEYKHLYRPDWNEVRYDIMKEILRAKASQHPYVLKKLLDTGDRILVENSWRDNVWGWGENRDGQNLLGKAWMEIREELRTK